MFHRIGPSQEETGRMETKGVELQEGLFTDDRKEDPIGDGLVGKPGLRCRGGKK